MIYNLGTTVPLTWVNGVTLGNATMAATAPSGAITTVTGISDSGTGTYTLNFNPAEAGLYDILWTASLSGVFGSYQDSLEVRQQGLNALISLQDARDHLRWRTTDTADNAKLQNMIEAASILIVDLVGPMSPQTFVEWFDGGVPQIKPANVPLVSITQVVEYYGLSAFTLTNQPLGSQTNAFAYTLDPVTYQLTRRTYGGAQANFATGTKNVMVSYIGGRPMIPENVQVATRELVRHLYTTSQVPNRSGVSRTSDTEAQLDYLGFAIPTFVIEMLQPHRRSPGIA